MFKNQSTREERAIEATAETGTDPAIVAAGAAVLLSWHQFILRDNKAAGLFIATWPATILAFASYFSQTKMSDRIQEAL